MKLADLSTREFLDNPYPLYEKLRSEGRVETFGISDLQFLVDLPL